VAELERHAGIEPTAPAGDESPADPE